MITDYDIQIEEKYHPENFATTVENEDEDCYTCGHGSEMHNNADSCYEYGCFCKELA